MISLTKNIGVATLTCLLLSLVSGQDVGQEMVKLMNEERKQAGLPEIAYSSNLAKVAQTHSDNMAQAKAQYPGIHDWYGEYACNFDSDYNCMWDKPSKLTSYKGKGYEISVQGATTPKAMLEGWKSSPAHADVIFSKGMWASQPWMAVGGGYKDGYGTMWFGHEKDGDSKPGDYNPGEEAQNPDSNHGDGNNEPQNPPPQIPPQQGGNKPQRPPQQPPQQGGNRPQRPPQHGGDRPTFPILRPPQHGGGQPQQPPQQGGNRPQRPPPQQPPQQGGDRPTFPILRPPSNPSEPNNPVPITEPISKPVNQPPFPILRPPSNPSEPSNPVPIAEPVSKPANQPPFPILKPPSDSDDGVSGMVPELPNGSDDDKIKFPILKPPNSGNSIKLEDYSKPGSFGDRGGVNQIQGSNIWNSSPNFFKGSN